MEETCSLFKQWSIGDPANLETGQSMPREKSAGKTFFPWIQSRWRTSHRPFRIVNILQLVRGTFGWGKQLTNWIPARSMPSSTKPTYRPGCPREWLVLLLKILNMATMTRRLISMFLKIIIHESLDHRHSLLFFVFQSQYRKIQSATSSASSRAQRGRYW